MTTSVKVHVNGRYRATVIKTPTATGISDAPVIVEGNYEGSPNPSGEAIFWLPHPAHANFTISEEAVPDAPAA